MSHEILYSRGTVSYEETLSLLEMRRVMNMLETENAKLKERLEMLTDIISPLMKQKKE